LVFENWLLVALFRLLARVGRVGLDYLLPLPLAASFLMKLWNNTPFAVLFFLELTYLNLFVLVAYFYSLHTVLTPFSVFTFLTQSDTFFVAFLSFFGDLWLLCGQQQRDKNHLPVYTPTTTYSRGAKRGR
jgi:hypothetical protein